MCVYVMILDVGDHWCITILYYKCYDLWLTLNQSFTYWLCILYIMRLHIAKVARKWVHNEMFNVFDFERLHTWHDVCSHQWSYKYLYLLSCQCWFCFASKDIVNPFMWWAERWANIEHTKADIEEDFWAYFLCIWVWLKKNRCDIWEYMFIAFV